MTRLLAALVIVAVGIVGAVIFLWPAQSTGPEPNVYGRDTCARCRMHLSQPGFAGELRSRDGQLTKYDDIGCMVHAMLAMHDEIPEAWVEDRGSGKFLPLLVASLVRAERAETPMGYGIVAFEDAGAAAEFATDRGGRLVTLEDVMKDAKALTSRPAIGDAG